MTELHDLLDRAVPDPVDVEVDLPGDLRRGHRALGRRRIRWAAVGVTGGLVVAGAAGYAALPRQQHEGVARPAADPGPQQLHTDFYDVPPAPPGWHLVGGNASVVVYREDGDTETTLDDFVGAVVVYLEDKSDPVHEGPPIPYHGRSFYEWGDGGGGVESMSVQQPDGDWLRLQYPKSAGFDSRDMIAFLDAVVVQEGAQGTRG